MQIKRFEIFLTLLHTKSFSQTAKIFGLTQPTVSAAIKSLEDSFGQKLFDRSPRKVKPLPSAETLAVFAKRIVETAGQANLALNHNLSAAKEKLSIGASSVPSLIFIPQALNTFQSKYPKVYLKVATGDSKYVTRQVADGLLDLALVGSNPNDEQLLSIPFSSDKLVLLASKTLINAMGKTPKTPNDLVDWPLILRTDGSGTRAAFLSSLNNNITTLNYIAEVNALGAAIALVRSSFGATVISNLLPPVLDLTNMAVIDLDFDTCRTFYLIQRRDSFKSPIIEAMSNIFKEIKQNFQAAA